MQDELSSEEVRRRATLAPGRAPGAAERYGESSSPSSSRMFAAYLADIEQLLDAQRREAALRQALDLPRIAVALADTQLRCTPEALQRWCEQWIRPPGAERDAQGVDHERIAKAIEERLKHTADCHGVPMPALRRLQLRRHARTAPRGFRAGPRPDLSARDNEAFETCTALIEAARRWYARSACHDPIVQANLARLAVLR
jgi:hypothetical protein